ncbi:MAG: hypothetical protein IH628_12280 [Proteobacteria bacterium]|nr:hypothetical protein [Pseudomonadota bacterium]
MTGLSAMAIRLALFGNKTLRRWSPLIGMTGGTSDLLAAVVALHTWLKIFH